MNLELTDEETAALLRELDGLIDGDRYFMSQRIKTLKVIRAKIRPEPVREPLPPPPKQLQRRGRRRSRDGARGAELREPPDPLLSTRQREGPAQNGGGPTISQPCRRRISLASAPL